MSVCAQLLHHIYTVYMTSSNVLYNVGPWTRLKSPYIASQTVARAEAYIVPRTWPKSPQLKVSFVGISVPWVVILISLLVIEMDCIGGRKHRIDDGKGYSMVQMFTSCDYVLIMV
ncbi:hypothetical protein B0T13DRAFT_469117 [Neurospora crassa]|nr:hypothetical protein B0T13DRAFT_469117 [Neurospora crassa]